MKDRKKNIQDDFRKRLGLLIDVPKPGFGSSNDGNTARRFFKNHEISSEITGINEDLIIRFYVILQCLSSGHKLDFKKFDKYCWETAEMYVELYPWYYMPPSVHKILCHGSSIAASFILPIGQLSEEAQEARNKDIKHFRENHTRQNINSDIFHRLLLSSDPLISSIREVKTKNRKLHQSARNLLINDDTEAESEVEQNYSNESE